MEKEKLKKFKLTWKEIGLPKLIIILLCSIFLIVVSIPGIFKSSPSGDGSQKEGTTTQSNLKKTTEASSGEAYVDELETRLKGVLSKVKGVGLSEVMITLSASKEKVTLKDEPYSKENTSETDSTGGSRIQNKETGEEKSVLVEGEDGSTEPYVVKETEPEIEGVIVVAEGGGDITIETEIIEAVEVLFGVSSHKIKVMKME